MKRTVEQRTPCRILDSANCWAIIIFIIIWDFLLAEQIFLTPQVKRSIVKQLRLKILRNQEISGKCQNFKEFCLVIMPPPKMIVSNCKNLQKIRNWTFPAVCYLAWKLKFVSNILSMIVSSDSFFFLTSLRPLQT